MRLVGKISILWLLILLVCAAAINLPRTQTPYNKTSLLGLNTCPLPCWIGIVPGRTTIGQARKLIQEKYSAAYDIETINVNPAYSFGYVVDVFARDRSHFLGVGFNELASVPQDDTSLVHEIRLYILSDTDKDKYVSTVGDLIVALGKPGCLAVYFGHHSTWPVMFYPNHQAELSVDDHSLEVTPSLPAGLFIFDQPFICTSETIAWHGFDSHYHDQLLASMLP